MPWNGAGEFRRNNGATNGPTTWRETEAAGRRIRTDDHDTHDEDLAQGLENCVARDGQNSPTANLPMAGRRHTGVQDAQDDSDYAAWGQVKDEIERLVNALENRLNPGVDVLADGAQIAWALNVNHVAQVTLGGNRTLANPTNAENGATYVLSVIQDATGGRSLAYGDDYDFGEEGAPILSSEAGKSDALTFLYRNNRMRLVGFGKGFDA